MIIRYIEQRDIEQVKQIHEKFYKTEFDFPNFNKFLHSFVVVNGDKVITAGGIKPIAESILITDKDVSVRQRCEALYEMLDGLKFTAKKYNLDQIHAFIDDSNWKNLLVKQLGFAKCKGDAIYLNV